MPFIITRDAPTGLRRGASKIGSHRRELVSVIVTSIWLSAVPAIGQSAMESETEAPIGRWLTDNGNLEVEIGRCGEALCGTVVKVLANRSMSGGGGGEMVAADNRSPLGMTVLKDFKAAGGGEWQGEIYNRENAKTYSCKISLSTPDQLTVRPYVGLPLFGKTLRWTRVATERVPN
jgi:uncharacterized protein (DUF2147 family)